jgi:uncharacterized membrane protein
MWIFWALLSAILVASRRPFEKRIISKLHHFTYGFLVQVLSVVPITIVTVLSHKLLNPIQLSAQFWLPLFVISFGFYPLNIFLYKQAIGHGELSKVLPLQSLWPVFSLVLAWITIKEVPSTLEIAAVMLTVVGVYSLGLKGRQLHHPLKPFREDKSSRAMVAGVALIACTSILEKVAIRASNPLFFSLTSACGASIALFLAARVTKQKVIIRSKPILKRVSLISALQSMTYITYLLAITTGPIARVSALRSTNILMGSMLGILLFKERLTKPKILSYVLIVAGAILLAQ